MAGALVCAAVWSALLLALGTDLSLWGWLGVLAAGGLERLVEAIAEQGAAWLPRPRPGSS